MSKEKLTNSVTKTLAFFDIFKRTLTLDEIVSNIIQSNSTDNQIKKNLKRNQTIKFKKPYYYLNNSSYTTTISKKQTEIKKFFRNKVKRFSPVFAICPFIKMLAICNTLAMDTASEKSDIDLFIITKKNRLFTARAFISLYLYLLKAKRHKNKTAGRFCLSFYISEDSLNIEKIQIKPADIYLSFWAKSLQPIINENETYEKFLKSNQNWLKNYFYFPLKPNKNHIYKNKLSKTIKSLQEKILNGFIGELFEKTLKKWQIKRANKKSKQLNQLASIIINKKMLKFHNIDKRKEIYEKWLETCKKFI